MTVPALLIAALIALWVFGGRAILLAAILRHKYGGRFGILGFTLGLVITPLLSTTAVITGGSFLFLICTIVTSDLFLAGVWVRNSRNRNLYTYSVQRKDLGILAYGGLCGLLTLYSGPFVEQITDGWWHMRHVAELLAVNSLAGGEFTFSGAFALEDLSVLLGLDASNYRIQAAIAWLADYSVLETWYASTIAVSGLLGVSFYLLCFQVLRSRTARLSALLFWLLILGGMNTGFRLSAWPAGLGYVFLNLGLVGSIWLWLDNRLTVSATFMVALASCGMAFFHLAELYLFALAIGFLVLAWIVKSSQGVLAAVAWLLVLFAGLSLAWILGAETAKRLSVSVTIPIVIMTFCVWGSVIAWKLLPSISAATVSILLAIIFIWFGVDGAHLVELFNPVVRSNPGYYDAYIPKFMAGIGNGLLTIPKWEHQLRASILWSGVFSVFLSVWLALNQRDQISYWLLALNIGPAVMLLSPPLFTLATMPVPIYGGYRVQYLVPVALTLAYSVSTALEKISIGLANVSLSTRILSVVALCLSVSAILPDAAVRLGLIKDRPWAVLSNVGFHWRLIDNRESIKTHSSWKYLDDIAIISDFIEDSPGMIVSDLATSYYLGAELGTQPLVQHPHHSNTGDVLNLKLLNFCDPRVPEGDLTDFISSRNKLLAENGLTQIKYLVINSDRSNYPAEVHGRSCVGETDHLTPPLSRFAESVYKGQYLSLWSLTNGMVE